MDWYFIEGFMLTAEIDIEIFEYFHNFENVNILLLIWDVGGLAVNCSKDFSNLSASRLEENTTAWPGDKKPISGAVSQKVELHTQL